MYLLKYEWIYNIYNYNTVKIYKIQSNIINSFDLMNI